MCVGSWTKSERKDANFDAHKKAAERVLACSGLQISDKLLWAPGAKWPCDFCRTTLNLWSPSFSKQCPWLQRLKQGLDDRPLPRLGTFNVSVVDEAFATYSNLFEVAL
jgi:hypothetical protein